MFLCLVILLHFSMTKKGHEKILKIERNFSGILEQDFWPPAPPPIFLYRRRVASANQN